MPDQVRYLAGYEPFVQADSKNVIMPDSRWSNMTNREAFDCLFQTQGINLVRGPLFDTVPAPVPGDFDFGKAEGMMLGLAIGDALGNTSEGDLPSRPRSSNQATTALQGRPRLLYGGHDRL